VPEEPATATREQLELPPTCSIAQEIHPPTEPRIEPLTFGHERFLNLQAANQRSRVYHADQRYAPFLPRHRDIESQWWVRPRWPATLTMELSARGLSVWHTPDGDRILTSGEWQLVQAGLELTWDAVEAAKDVEGDPDATGVRVFDDLQHGQQIGLLAIVGKALTDPTMPSPPLSAATESTLAAIFAMLRGWLDVEIDVGAHTTIRQLILGAVSEVARDDPLPAPADKDEDEWDMLIEEVEDRLLWDADFEMGDEFLDLPPDAGQELLNQNGIDPDYFLTVPEDLTGIELEAARRTLAELTGKTTPGVTT
jgi:hypothetical protein